MAVRVSLVIVIAACAGLVLSASGSGAAKTTRNVAFGVADDAWLGHGSGTLASRLDELASLGPDVVRYTVRWDQVARKRPRNPRDPDDPAYRWGDVDAILRGLRRHGIAPVVTLYGTPSWANGGRGSNWAPASGRDFADFAYAAGRRYVWVRDWTIWNEPNRTVFFRPTSAKAYVETLLDPAYGELHAAIPAVRVAGGVTAPRAGSAGIAPVPWIRSMGKAHAKLDAYAHNPYPGRPQSETPWGPKCVNCQNITMADLERLEREVKRSFGNKPIWLTEYGYQTNPPDPLLGVAPDKQATYVSSAALRVFRAHTVAMLIFFMVRDDPEPAGWQSGFLTDTGALKPSFAAFRFPLVQTARHGASVGLWGQVRPRSGKQPYRIRLEEDERAGWIGGTRWTDDNGFLSVDVTAPPGSRLRIWSPRDAAYGFELIVR